MRAQTAAALSLSVLGFFLPARARADDARLAAPKEGEALVRRLLGKDDAQRAAARQELETAAPERLRTVIAALLDAILQPAPAPAAPAPLEGMEVPLAPPALAPAGPVQPIRSMPPPPESGRCVSIEARFLRLGAERARDLLGADAAGGRVRFRRVPADEVTRILASVAGRDGGVGTVTASRITVYDGQRATVEVMNKVSYIRELDVTRDGGQTTADPVIAQAAEGLSLDVLPTISEDGRRIEVDLHATSHLLERPIEEEEVAVPGAEEAAKVQRPVSLERGWRRTVSVPEGGSVLAGPFAMPGEEAGVVSLLLTVTAEAIEGAPRAARPGDSSK